MQCPICQKEIEFCPDCGASLTVPDSAAEIAAMLVFGDPADSVQTAFRLSLNENLIGRRDPHKNRFPDIDLTPFDPKCHVSRFHARAWFQDEQLFVEDLGSCNGTYVSDEGREIKASPGIPCLVRPGSRIRFGNVTGSFVLGRDQ